MDFKIDTIYEIAAEDIRSSYCHEKGFHTFKKSFYNNLFQRNCWTTCSLEGLDAHVFQQINKINASVEQFFIEAGANNGIRQSNTFVFEKCFNWKGLLVEPISYNLQECKKYRSSSKCIEACISSVDGQVTGVFHDDLQIHRKEKDNGLGSSCAMEQLLQYPGLAKTVDCYKYETICQINNVPKKYAFLSLDVEGHEVHIIGKQTFATYRPALICIETSDLKVIDDILSQNYELVETVSHNFLLLDSDL